MIEVLPIDKPKKDRLIKALFKPKRKSHKTKKEFSALFQRECDKLRKESK